MKHIRMFSTAIAISALVCILPNLSLAAEKSLADILREKGILTEEEYQAAKKVEEDQAAKAEEKAKVEAEKAVKAAEKPSSLPVAGYKDGFFLQTPDEKLRLRFNGYVRAQLRLYENNTSQDNEFKIRHARMGLTGYFGKYWQGRVEGEFSTPSDGNFLKYAYLNTSYLPDLQVRAGQFKAPFSREYQTSSSEIDTIERAMVTDSGNTVPKYDIGVMLHGPRVLDGLLNYGLGIFNGNGANNLDTNDDMDFVGRLVLAPFAPTQVSALKGLEFGGSYQVGRQTPTQSYRPRLPAGWDGFFPSINYRGERMRYGADFVYRWRTPTWGGFKLQGEYIYQSLERENQATVDGELVDLGDLISWGWYILGTAYVWGDENKGIQLVARYEQFDVDDDPVKKYQEDNPMGENSYANRFGNAFNIRGNTADILTLGINYFPMKNLKLAFNWFYQDLENKWTTDKIEHDSSGNEVVTAKGGAMNAFYFLAQVRW